MTQPATKAVANASEATSQQPGNKPVDKIRIGNITASIWRNSSEKGEFYTATFERSYKDETGALKNSQSFPRSDLLELAKIADKAHDRILELQARGRT